MAEVFDGFVSLLDGMSGGINPAIIPETAYAKGINISSRGGLIHTRPGFVKVSDLGSGTFQGAARWSLNSGDRVVVASSDRIRVINVDTGAVLFNEALHSSNKAQFFFEQADRYLVIQNGADAPVVLQEVSGVVSQVAQAEVSLPPGYLMRYIHGRVHTVPVTVGGEDGRPYFVSGDVVLPDEPTAVLKATETEYWNEGGAHGLPAEMGFIRGMAAMRNSATGTGAGALLVMGRRGVCAFDLSIERQFWKENALSQVLFFDAGTDSPWSPISVNNDVAYRSQDGIRFIKFTGSMLAGSSLSNVPQSNEVSPFLNLDDGTDDLPWVSSSLGDNRLLMTSGGRVDQCFRGLISLDFAQVHGMQGVDTPAYDGIYTGYAFCQTVSALYRNALHSFSIVSKGGSLFLYRLDPNSASDYSVSGAAVPIKASITTRVMAFKGLDVKVLEYIELWLSDVKVDTDVAVYYRPAGYPKWALASARSVLVPSGTMPQARRRIRIPLDGNPPVSPVTGEQLTVGHEFQFVLQFTGWAQVDKFRVVARTETEGTPPPCTDVAVSVDSTDFGVELNDFDYEAG